MTDIIRRTPILHIPNGIATVDIFFYLPDYPSLVEEFVWQTSDFYPDYPRVQQFLEHWSKNIEAVIKEIVLTHDRARGERNVRIVHDVFTLQ